MARKSVPFEVVVHYTGKKTNAEIQKIYVDFYISQAKKMLENSGLSGSEKRALLEELITHYSQKSLETGTSKPP